MSSHMEVKRDIDTGKEIFALTVEGLHIDQVEKVAVKLAKDKVVRPIVQTRVRSQLVAKMKTITD